MKNGFNRLVSLVISCAAAVMCMVSPAVNAVQPVKKASKMLWEVQNVSGNAGSDVQVEVIVQNAVGMTSIDKLSLLVDGNITPQSVTASVGGNVSYEISGNKMTMNITGLKTGGNGSTVLTATYHINDSCPVGYYKVSWEAKYAIGRLGDGSAYYPMFDYGYIHVEQGGQPAVTTTTSTSTTTTTTTTTTTSTTTTTTSTTTTTTTSTTTTTTTSSATTTTTKPDPSTDKYDLGDVNNDGTVDGTDATLVLREFGNVLAGKGAKFNDKEFAAGDVDRNGTIDGSDATLILKFFGEAGKDINVSYGGMQKWMDENFWKKN